MLIPGLSRKHIFEAVEASLKRLDTDYIDVLQIHRYDYDTPREETMKALHGAARSVIVLIVDLVEMGKVRYIGASSIFAYQFIGLQNVADKNGWTKFISMQNQYSLLYREEEREMIPACKELGVGYDSPIRQLTQGVSRGGLLRVEFSLDLQTRQRLDLPMVSSKECWHRRNSKPLERASSIVLKNWPKRKVYPWRKWQLPGFWQTMVYRSRFIC